MANHGIIQGSVKLSQLLKPADKCSACMPGTAHGDSPSELMAFYTEMVGF